MVKRRWNVVCWLAIAGLASCAEETEGNLADDLSSSPTSTPSGTDMPTSSPMMESPVTSASPGGSSITPTPPQGSAGNSASPEPAATNPALATGGTGGSLATPTTPSPVGTAGSLATGGATLGMGGTPAVGGEAGGGPASTGGTGGAGQGGIAVTEDIFVANVFSGHPLPFALVTFEDRQFVAYYDDQQQMTVAQRTLGEDVFTYQTLPTTVGWDSHNYIAMAVDESGYIHVSGNMHNVPLIYFKSTSPLDISTLAQVPQMVGTNEASVTYPEFFVGPAGNLIFIYRDGGSGNGSHIFNTYDANAGSWSRLLDTPLTDGEGQRNAYPVGPIQDPLGRWHLVWVWRGTPDATTNSNLSYAQTQNLTDWTSGAGQPLTLPITLGTSDIVDPVPEQGGMINNNTKVGFDSQNRPIVVYHKYDANGYTQLYNTRLEDGEWVVHQTTDWTYRWDFGGDGTLVFEIEVEGVKTQPDGTLTQRYYHAQYGGWGAFRLDPDTLAAVEEIPPPNPYPADLDAPRSTTPEMVVRWQRDWGSSGNADVAYMLRWETLPSNRDMPRSPVPPSTELRLYGFSGAL